MPWRALGARRAASLVVCEQGTPEWLLLKLGTRDIAVVPVLRRAGGLLLGLPMTALTDAECSSKTVEGVTSDLGPVHVVQAEGYLSAEDDAEPVEVSLLVLDWPQELYPHLRASSGELKWPPKTIWPQSDGGAVHSIDFDQLAVQARSWVEDGDGPHSEAYATATEGTPRPSLTSPTDSLLHQLLKQVQHTAAAVTNLQGDLEDMKHSPGSASMPAAAGGQLSALGKARAIVGAPPRTAAPQVAGGVGPLGEVPEDVDVEVDDPGGMSTDQLLKTALVSLLTKKDKSKAKRKPGLPLGGASSSEEELEDPLRRLAGAKGSMLLERLKSSMESDPAAYIQAIKANAAQLLGEATDTPTTVERFVKDEMPMGSEKSLGFATWGITRAVTMMGTGQHAAYLVADLLLTLAAIEQYRLDSSWTAAWRLTMQTQPPFADWRAKENMIHQLRADHAHSRLVHPTWAAAVVARLHDEEVLTKRRGKGADRADRRPPRGRGKGAPQGEPDK